MSADIAVGPAPEVASEAALDAAIATHPDAPVPPAAAPKQRVMRGVALMLGCGVMVSAMEAGVRGVSQGLHPFLIVFWREVASICILVPLWFLAGRPLIAAKRLPLHGARAILNGLAIASWYYALRETPLAEATAIIFTSILFAVMLSAAFLRERVVALQWVAVVAGLAGAALIVGPRFDLDAAARFGALVALGSAALFGVSVTVAKLTMRGDGSIVSALVLAIGMGTVALALAVPHWTWPTRENIPYLVAFGICNVGGQVFFLEALRYANASVIIPLDVLRLVFALLFGVVLYAEFPSVPALIGAAIVAGSCVLVVAGARR